MPIRQEHLSALARMVGCADALYLPTWLKASCWYSLLAQYHRKRLWALSESTVKWPWSTKAPAMLTLAPSMALNGFAERRMEAA